MLYHWARRGVIKKRGKPWLWIEDERINEVAPAQHELAPVFTTTNISTDHKFQIPDHPLISTHLTVG